LISPDERSREGWSSSFKEIGGGEAFEMAGGPAQGRGGTALVWVEIAYAENGGCPNEMMSHCQVVETRSIHGWRRDSVLMDKDARLLLARMPSGRRNPAAPPQKRLSAKEGYERDSGFYSHVISFTRATNLCGVCFWHQKRVSLGINRATNKA
jgi:hypothetical protein